MKAPDLRHEVEDAVRNRSFGKIEAAELDVEVDIAVDIVERLFTDAFARQDEGSESIGLGTIGLHVSACAAGNAHFYFGKGRSSAFVY